MKRNKPELLAPAGDLERLKWAIHYGADAVYLGGPAFGLRANATNLTLEDLKEGCAFAHARGKKIYVTVNIVLHKKELDELKDYLKELEKIGVDAIIVSDPAVIAVASENTSLEIHLSTQQSTINKKAIQFWEKHGVTRIVLGRECSKEEIKEIVQNSNIEIECFIHGAMCSSYSGRCVLSNFFTNRDANRGGCSQICRWNFDLYDDDNITKEKEFTLSTKDLSLLKYIPDLVDLNVSSLKIEGRMRSIYYIATVVDIYRKAIDEYCSGKDYKYNKKYEKILANCANRDSIPQFFDGNKGPDCQYYNGRDEVSNQDFLGVVLAYQDGYMTVEERNYFKLGDIVEIFGPEIPIKTLKITDIKDEDGNPLEVVRHPRQIVKIKMDEVVYPMNLIRIKKS